MGRRALPPIDTSVDLEYHLKSPDQLPKPWDQSALFEQAAPLEVEVGSGKGLFMQNAAQAVPEHNFLGIEIARKYAKFSATRLAKQRVMNAIMVAGDALSIFREVIPDASLTAVHVYFPDPWWKKRHRKRRVLSPEFLQDISRTLMDGGQLHFWTDVEEYFTTTLKLLENVPSLQGPQEVEQHSPEHDLDYRTHFERRKRKEGLPIYRSLYIRETRVIASD